MQCTNGHDNPDGQKFCGECGAPIVASSEPPLPLPPPDPTHGSDEADEPSTRSPRRGKRLWIALAIAVAAIVVIVAIASGGDDTSEKARKASGKTHTSVVSNDTPIVTTPTTEPAKHEVTITGNGFTQLPPDSIGNSYASYGVIVQNPSDDIATRVSLNVAFYNDAGVVVKADNPTIDVILPGQTAAYGETMQVAGATRMEVQALVGSWQTATATTGAFTASGVSTTAAPVPRAADERDAELDVRQGPEVGRRGGDLPRRRLARSSGATAPSSTSCPRAGRPRWRSRRSPTFPRLPGTEVYAELSNLSLLGT